MQPRRTEAIEELLGLTALERVLRAGELIETLRQDMAAIAHVRSEAVAELRGEGMTVAEIARHLNVTRQQVHRLKQAAAG